MALTSRERNRRYRERNRSSIRARERRRYHDQKDLLAGRERSRYGEQKARALAKLGGECVSCGTEANLQFDHIDPDTKYLELGNMFATYAVVTIDAELAKCQLLCISCHAAKTNRER